MTAIFLVSHVVSLCSAKQERMILLVVNITIVPSTQYAVMMIIYICGINDPFLYHAGDSNDSNASEDMCASAGCCWNEVAMPHSSACTIVHYDLYLAPIPLSPSGSGALLH